MANLWHITATSCQYQTRPMNIDDIVKLRPVAHFMNGDAFYFAPGQQQLYGMTTPDAAVSNVANDWLRKFQQGWFHSSWQKLANLRLAGATKLYWCPDDHGWGGSDWDHSKANANGGNNGIGAANQSETLTHWSEGVKGHDLIRRSYFDNPPNGAPNGNIPDAMLGTAAATDYPVLYFALDYGSNGEPGGKLIRVLFPDCISYKHKISSPDVQGKTMLGAAQKTWMYDQFADAKRQGFAQVIVVSSKDLFNLTNDDGWKSYLVEMNEILGVIDLYDYPVVWVSGDRHSPHVALQRKANGDNWDTFCICACPCTVDGRPQVFYPQCMDLNNDNGAGCWAKITVNETDQVVRYSIMDLWTGVEWRGYNVPFYSRIPAV